MDFTISATELARKLGDVLGRIRYRGDSFVVQRNGEPVARIAPLATHTAGSVLEGLRAWREAAPRDAALADDLDRVNRADSPPDNPWGSSSTPAR
jgi:antitoxin (DNA-binding transcriptional repressor) of toxin-antitoxin stability system